MNAKILLADDDAGLRRVIQYKLKQGGHEVMAVADGESALGLVRSQDFDVLITDLKMPGLSGIELLEKVRALKPSVEVILITAFAEVPAAVRAIKLGAFDYLTKPFDDDQLMVTIDKALRFKNLEKENRLLRDKLNRRDAAPHIIGTSPLYREVMAMVDKIAPTDATVLITGESGTGKEVIARTIHERSLRADKNFVAINCAAIPRDLLESELFGHVAGAFTGAVRDKKGKFQLAEGGTLLLDEISELSIDLQAKLLRTIQERIIEPLGSETRLEVDIRLLAATNKNLKAEVASGRFREDLYYRLNVIPIHIPALRERPEDIAVMVKGFLSEQDADHKIRLDSELMARLINHNWPGNVRELENLIERMVILRSSDTLTISDLPRDFTAATSSKPPITPEEKAPENLSLFEAEKNMVIGALNKFSWNRSRAAEYLKIPRHVLVYRMKKYGLFRSNHAVGNSGQMS